MEIVQYSCKLTFLNYILSTALLLCTFEKKKIVSRYMNDITLLSPIYCNLQSCICNLAKIFPCLDIYSVSIFLFRAIHDVKATDMGNNYVRYKAEVDFDGRELTRSYLDSQDLDNLLSVCISISYLFFRTVLIIEE